MKKLLILITLVVILGGCQREEGVSNGGGANEEARALVEKYASIISDAYREGDVRLINPIVGPNTEEGKKLTGLIGVNLDMGIILDANMLELEVVEVQQMGEVLHIKTKERWKYRNLKKGTTQLVGEESLDYYELLYIFKKYNEEWMVAVTKFTAPPKVGRTKLPWGQKPDAVHPSIKPKTTRQGDG